MKLSSLLRIGIGLSTLIFVIYIIGWGEVFYAVKQMNSIVLVPVLLLMIGSLIVTGIKYESVLRAFGKKIPVFTMTWYATVCWAYSLFIPGRLGDLGIFFFLKKHDVPNSESSVAIILDKISMLGVVGAVASIGLFMFIDPIQAAILTVSGVILGLLTLMILGTKKGRGLLQKIIHKKIKNVFSGFGNAITTIKKRPSVLILQCCLAAIRLVLFSAILYVLLLGFISASELPSFELLIIINAVTMIVSLIPITLGGLGIREGIGVYLLSLYLVPIEVSGAALIVYAALRYILGTIIIGIHVLKK